MSDNTQFDFIDQSNIAKKEFSLLQEIMKEKFQANEELEFESLEGYELPPSYQFTMLKKPAVTFKGNRMQFSMAAVRLFQDFRYVLPMINAKTKRLVVIPCKEEDNGTVEWSRIQKSTGKIQNKPIISEEVFRKLFHYMGWDPTCRYKIIGRTAYTELGLSLVFDLEDAIMFAPKKQQVYDPVSGKNKMKDIKYYPERYKDCFGISYSDYIATKNQDEMEYIGDYESVSNINLEEAAESESSVQTSTAIPTTQMPLMLPQPIYHPEETAYLKTDTQEDELKKYVG